MASLSAYLALGIYFGIVITKAEVISWFRIQEMFRFQAFHMYGVLASAVLVAALSLALLRRAGARTLGGETIRVPPKDMGRGVRYGAGGTLFGLGWAVTGACPGPLFALVGNGLTVFPWPSPARWRARGRNGWLRPRLPH